MNPGVDFEQVGPRVELGDVVIDSAQAEVFRRAALSGTKVSDLAFSDDASRIRTTSYATGVLSDAFADYAVPESFFTGLTEQRLDPRYWRSQIRFSRYSDKNRETRISNIYQVEMNDGQVMFAARRVEILRNLARIATDEDGEPTLDVYDRQRKAFEQPMTADDVEMVAQKALRITSRQRVTSKR